MTDEASLPSGTITFSFTDLERSSNLWESDPEAMDVALTAMTPC